MADTPDYDGRGFLTYEGFCRQQRGEVMARSDHSDRSKAERIQRLKERLDKREETGAEEVTKLRSVLKGLLDLLADEL